MTLYAHVNGSTVDTVSALPRTVSLGLLYEPTPITPAPSGTILDGGTL